jgi:hypothetical protein
MSNQVGASSPGCPGDEAFFRHSALPHARGNNLRARPWHPAARIVEPLMARELAGQGHDAVREFDFSLAHTIGLTQSID